MEISRPAIPADIKRRVQVESGHRCAIPYCRHIKIELHHIIPWSRCKAHEYENLIALCPNCHDLADNGAIDAVSLRLYKSRLRLAHDRFSNLEVDILFELDRLAPQPMPWPSFNLMLAKRLADDGLVSVVNLGNVMQTGPLRMDLLMLSISPSGQRYVASLSDPSEG